MPDTTQDLRLVLLDLHPATTTIAPLASFEFVIDLIPVDRHTRGQPFNYRDERATVCFSGCCESKTCSDRDPNDSLLRDKTPEPHRRDAEYAEVAQRLKHYS